MQNEYVPPKFAPPSWRSKVTMWARDLPWAFYRARKRAAHRKIERLIARHRWHGTVLDTSTPNVPFLKVKSLVVINGYGQEHVIR